MKKVKVGVIGCGFISNIYLKNMTQVFDILEVKGVYDLFTERAEQAAKEFNIPVVYQSDADMFADPEIEIVLILTTPPYHAAVAEKALQAGKNVYIEKPLAVTREDGLMLKRLAEEKKLLLGGAPDTFLGGGIQTCRKLIDDGWIGEPIAATAFFTTPGHERWHPNPEFYYKAGAGPIFDMGPYYLTALVNLLGPIESVAGYARKTYDQRTITSEPKFGQKIDVEVPTHVAGCLQFVSGAIGTLITSFDVWAAQLPRIEIYGTEGSLSVPDPDFFTGTVKLFRSGMSDWQETPVIFGYTENSRGVGLADMAYALRSGRKHRASVDLTYHVLDAMQAFLDASREGVTFRLSSTCEKPAPMAMNLLKGTLDE